MNGTVTCDVCDKPLWDRYVIDEWGNKSHVKHEALEIKFCFSCGRILSQKTSGGCVEIGDLRNVCGICMKSAILSREDVESQKQRVLRLLKMHSFKNVPSDFSVELLSLNDLVRVSDSSCLAVKGLTVSELSRGKQFDVHRIYILSHLPKEEFVAILAHEILHVWINHNRIELNEKDVEGFCNIGSYLVYYKNNTLFSTIKLQRMENDMDFAYGQAYRKLRTLLITDGWSAFLNRITNQNKNLIL